MKKVINLGKVDYNGIGRKINTVEIKIELKEKETATHYETLQTISNVPVFTASGGIWNNIKSDYICCGQMIDEIAKLFPNYKQVQRIKEIWERFHLNDMKTGTKKQTEIRNETKLTDYEEICAYLKLVGCYEDNGYKYGHGWLYEPIPEDILNEIKSWF
jgi:hypothetical protein